MHGDWDYDLYYDEDRTDQNGSPPVRCPNFKLTYNSEKKYIKSFIPRSCMDEAPNKVKFKSMGGVFSNSDGGQAGPTDLLSRG